MSLFRSETERGVWIEMNCARCWRYTTPDTGCPILPKAVARDRKPPEWQRNPRANTIAGMYKCDEFATEPPRIKRQEQQFEDVPMFDVTPYASERPGYVPVEGWPERPGTVKEVDHQ